MNKSRNKGLGELDLSREMELEESKPRMISVKSNELDKRSKFLFLAQVYFIRFEHINVSDEWYRRIGFTRIKFEYCDAL